MKRTFAAVLLLLQVTLFTSGIATLEQDASEPTPPYLATTGY